MTRLIITVLWLTVVWIALWESITWANFLGGLAIALFATALVPLRERKGHIGFRPLPVLKLVVFFAWKLAEASVIVAWEIATPKDRTSPAVVHVPLHTTAPGIITAVANMVSLTPGTLTIEADRESATLYIHVLHFATPEATRSDVYQLERLTLDAFPPDASMLIDRAAQP